MKTTKQLFCAVILIVCFSKIADAQTCTLSLSSPDTAVCAGAPVQLIAGLTGGGCNSADSAQWYNGNTYIVTSFDPGFDTTLTAPLTAGSYDFNALLFYNTADTAFDTITIVVTAPLGANTISSAQTICSGNAPATLNGNAVSGGNGTVTYLWQQSATGPSTGFGAASGTNNTQNYSPPSLTADRWYRRVATSGPCSDTSASLQITVNPPLTANTISAAQTICANQTPAPLTGSNVTGGSGTTTYLWFQSITGPSSGFSTATGTNNGQNYSPPSLAVDRWYKRAATAGPCTDTSAAIKITVNPALTANTISSAQSICSGETPNPLAGSLVTGGTGTITYLWQQSTTGSTSGFTTASGTSNGQNYNPPALTADRWYRRVVTSGSCNDTSAALKITVKATPSVTTTNLQNPICSGGTTNISLSPAPNNVAGTQYTWTISNNNVSGTAAQASPVAGPIQQTVTLVNTTVNGSVTYTITPVASGCDGTPVNVTVTVNPGAGQTPVITSSIANDTVCSNTHGLNFTISNVQSGITYVWNATPSSITIIGDSLSNCIVNIPASVSGNVTIFTSASNQFNCAVTGSTTFYVDTADAHDTTLVYLYKQAKTLVCMNNTFESYQWGYDSLNLSPVSLSGEKYQDYILSSLSDTLEKYFWVITGQGDCYTKSYYNPPNGAGRSIEVLSHSGFTYSIANPDASHGFDLFLSGEYLGLIQMRIYDVQGREVFNEIISKNHFQDRVAVPFISNVKGVFMISLIAKNNAPVSRKFVIISHK